METKTLGDYNIVKLIGQGSLGAVYLAEHRFIKKPYILKVFPEELGSDRSFIQRFEEEIGLLAGLDHDHIVKIHNICFAQGHYFLVTDCVVDEVGETTNLTQFFLARGKYLDEDTAYSILSQVADALDYAHNKRMVHRGLKLNNLLIGKGKEIYLSDFGLSRIIGTGAVLTRTYKAVADTLGLAYLAAQNKIEQEKYPSCPIDPKKLTPLHLSFLQNFAFLAPEQKNPDKMNSTDYLADNYSFGILAYYLLTGDFPEGIFDLPTAKRDYKWDWNQLITGCLQMDPHKRPEQLVPVLQSVQGGGYQPYVRMAQEYIIKEEVPSHSYAIAAAASYETSQAPRPILKTAELAKPVTDPDPASKFLVDPTVKNYVPERKEEKEIQPLLTEMVVIPGGNYIRGSTDGNRDELPKHQVTLSTFAIDIHPVTNEQFVRFLEVMGGEKDNNHHDIIRLRDSRIKRSGGKLSIESGYAKHPVVGVTWYGALAYAKWVGKRLPTEAEWEVAATAGIEGALYPTGDDIEKSQANFFSSDTTAVMSYTPNPIGLYDMPGNVYEWCHDWYGYNYYEMSIQEPENPKGPLQGVYRVLRGGCWKSLKEDLRCSRRHRNNPGTVNGTYGFRCAADAE